VKSSAGGVNITILGKEFMVACPDGEREALSEAARHLDERMREIQTGGNVVGGERVAVMAALNLANELLQLRRQAGSLPDGFDARLSALHSKIDAALQE